MRRIGYPTIHPHAQGGYVWTNCAECGPDISVDEDGCCLMCGRDAVFYGRQPREDDDDER